MANLIEEIQEQCKRCREVVLDYRSIGPAGMFGAAMIEADIRKAEAAIASGDVVEMIGAYKVLKEVNG